VIVHANTLEMPGAPRSPDTRDAHLPRFPVDDVRGAAAITGTGGPEKTKARTVWSEPSSYW